MKWIELTKGQIALVDDRDYDYLQQFNWVATVMKPKNKSYGFRAVATCNCPFSKKWHTVYMHRLLMQCPREMEVDHIDHNPLNNQRRNLRICTHAENMANSVSRKNSSSQYKGVSWSKKSRKWDSYICVNSKLTHLGFFRDEQNAAKAYDFAARECFGEFANLNFK